MATQTTVIANSPKRPWWKDVICYQVWPLSFKDSNGDGMGDIRGVISKLDYLKDFGVDCIWICPMYKSPMADYGYDISDWQAINPQMGTMADMEELIAEVHEKEMKILLDLVVTHTSIQHPWFIESRKSKGEENEKRDWYIWVDPRRGHKIPNPITGTVDLVEEPTNYCGCFATSPWEYVAERDQYYMHLFMIDEPDLNWELAHVRQAVCDAAIGFWLDKDIDGFRVDTSNRMSKDFTWPDAPVKLPGKYQPGSDYYINGKRQHEFLKEIRAYIDNHPSVKGTDRDLVLVGELPRTDFDEVMRYIHPDSKEMNMVFDFDMIKLGGHDDPDEVKAHEVKNLCDGHPSFTLPEFKRRLKKVQDLIANGAWGTIFMENHDQCRSLDRYATPDPQYRDKAAKLLCLLQTTLSGTQFIFQGQEIAMTNMPKEWGYDEFRDVGSKDYLDSQQEMAEAKDGVDAGLIARENARVGTLKLGRDNSRTPVQWTSGKNAGFSDIGEGMCWFGVNSNYKEGINVEDQQNDNDSIWHFWRKHIQMRKDYRETFMHGDFRIVEEEHEQAFCYFKGSPDGEVALLCLNFSDSSIWVELGQFDDTREWKFLTGNCGWQPDGFNQKNLEPWEGRIYLSTADNHDFLKRFDVPIAAMVAKFGAAGSKKGTGSKDTTTTRRMSMRAGVTKRR